MKKEGKESLWVKLKAFQTNVGRPKKRKELLSMRLCREVPITECYYSLHEEHNIRGNETWSQTLGPEGLRPLGRCSYVFRYSVGHNTASRPG